jgi:GNAT superfamily N-acetyltransferase
MKSMARVQIRLAKSSDWDVLAEMRYRFRAELGSPTEPKSRFVRRCASWMQKHFRTRPHSWRCWVVDDRTRLLGHICVQLLEKMPNPLNEPELHAYVTNFYLLPEMRSRGFGRQLLHKALSWCRAQGADAVILWASPGSRSLYRRCGFAEPADIFELRQGARLPRSLARGRRC